MVKEQLLAEAEKLVPVTDARGSQGHAARHPGALGACRRGAARLAGPARRRAAQDRGDRAQGRGLALAAHEPRGAVPRPGTVEQIRTAITQLERQLAKAETNGDQKAQQQAKEAIEARKSWLAEAERTLAELAG